MKTVALPPVLALLSLFATSVSAQQSSFERLPPEAFDVRPPSEWVAGTPGQMTARPQQCHDFPSSELRQRIVDIAVQEWGFFGFPVLDQVGEARLLPPGATRDPDRPAFESLTAARRAPLLNGEEASRVAASIAGYWAATPDGAWVLDDQNRAWNGRRGVGARWTSPWSAAFISWVMCESGLGRADRFQRSIAHHAYIDQSIRARDGQAPEAAFVAFDIGEEHIEPGDMLCSGRRPEYNTLAERRREMGAGAGTHCDIVVSVDQPGERILVIGGNVLRSVSLKVLPADRGPEGRLQPLLARQRPLFAHLKLRAEAIDANAMARSPTLNGIACREGLQRPSRASFVVSALAMGEAAASGCLERPGVDLPERGEGPPPEESR